MDFSLHNKQRKLVGFRCLFFFFLIIVINEEIFICRFIIEYEKNTLTITFLICLGIIIGVL